MTYRPAAFALLIALSGCDFDFGGEKGSQERSAVTITVTSDGGTSSVVNQSGCTFVPCADAYGTNCGFVCPTQ